MYVRHVYTQFSRFVVIGFGKYGPLTRYVKLRVAHEPGMPETFSPATAG